ncbi:hypothetical protein GO013_16320 [Pseudodesulfovibrio sp. JC047]|uniref:hypothetical protein n=1 Tax=Pseudodesulfovibrio sp. JC047 TaxID=2683199 RepID=UPI0013D26A5E|nr:hypothetical protein [Pseudodesulfovibrio sp. JC047]NDV20978.1 hypothetical protein [Pseudodesulfovibrio sp. JC047]
MSDLPLEYARCYDPGCPLWQSGECARAEELGNSMAVTWLRPRRQEGGKDCEKKIVLPGVKADSAV